MSTCVLYVDEAGNPDGHHIPIRSGETPLFTLAGVAFPLWEWRARDRSFNAIKRQFFPDLIEVSSKRPEEYEIKGRDLTSPHNATSQRRHQFFRQILSFIRQHSGVCFGVSFLKNPNEAASSRSLYTQALQILVERFSLFITEHPAYSNGIIICDSRMKGMRGSDIEVARSHMSFIFGHETGRTFINILEAPLFADSRLTVGLQIADIFASALFTNHYHYYLRELPNAPDYKHMSAYWSTLRELEFKSKAILDGHQVFGYRVINQKD